MLTNGFSKPIFRYLFCEWALLSLQCTFSISKKYSQRNTILKRISLFFRERKHREEAAEREKAERLERERVEKERKEQERIKRERVGERGHILKETAQAQAAVDQHFTESLRLASQKVRIVKL